MQGHAVKTSVTSHSQSETGQQMKDQLTSSDP